MAQGDLGSCSAATQHSGNALVRAEDETIKKRASIANEGLGLGQKKAAADGQVLLLNFRGARRHQAAFLEGRSHAVQRKIGTCFDEVPDACAIVGVFRQRTEDRGLRGIEVDGGDLGQGNDMRAQRPEHVIVDAVDQRQFAGGAEQLATGAVGRNLAEIEQIFTAPWETLFLVNVNPIDDRVGEIARVEVVSGLDTAQ